MRIGFFCQASEYARETADANFAEIEVRLAALESGSAIIARTINTTPPLYGGGNLSADRTLSMNQATATTDGYLSMIDWATFNAKMTNPMTAAGDIIYSGGGGTTPTPLAIGAVNTVLHAGGAPSWSTIVEDDITLDDVGTLNVSTTKHGLCPILSNNAAQYLNGQGNWATPSAAINAYTTHPFAGSVLEVITHNFGAYPVVQVIDGAGAVIAPASITNDDVNQVTITFGAPTTGTIILTVGSPQAQMYKAVAVDYTVLTTDRIIKVTVAGKTITMMTAVGNTGREFVIDNASNGNITLEGDGVEEIEGEAAQTLPPDSAIHVYSDGAGWRIY